MVQEVYFIFSYLIWKSHIKETNITKLQKMVFKNLYPFFSLCWQSPYSDYVDYFKGHALI